MKFFSNIYLNLKEIDIWEGCVWLAQSYFLKQCKEGICEEEYQTIFSNTYLVNYWANFLYGCVYVTQLQKSRTVFFPKTNVSWYSRCLKPHVKFLVLLVVVLVPRLKSSNGCSNDSVSLYEGMLQWLANWNIKDSSF